jgi:hypothetical protein
MIPKNVQNYEQSGTEPSKTMNTGGSGGGDGGQPSHPGHHGGLHQPAQGDQRVLARHPSAPGRKKRL